MSDAKIRKLEREYAQSPDRDLLIRIDFERYRASMHPHKDTRLSIASEQYSEYNYRCFMILLNLENALDYIFQESEEVRILTEVINERQYIPEIRQVLQLRSLTMDDAMGAVAGQPYRKPYLDFLEEQGIEPVEYGALPEGAFESGSMMPHMEREGATERWQMADRFRREYDAECYDLLNSLARLGILSASNLMPYYEDDEEVADLLLQIESALEGRDLSYQEVLLARLDFDPKPAYIAEIGDHHWWRHIKRLMEKPEEEEEEWEVEEL